MNAIIKKVVWVSFCLLFSSTSAMKNQTKSIAELRKLLLERKKFVSYEKKRKKILKQKIKKESTIKNYPPQKTSKPLLIICNKKTINPRKLGCAPWRCETESQKKVYVQVKKQFEHEQQELEKIF